MRFISVPGLAALLCLLPSAAQAFQTQGPEWDIERGPIIVRIHQDGSEDVTDGSDITAIEDAFRAWGCIEGAGVRFRVGEPLTEKSDEQVENEIHVFFDETGQFGLDNETRSRSFFEAFLPDQFSIRDKAVIIFNGRDFTWGTNGFTEQVSDIESIMHIEIAVTLGLDVCEGGNCAGGDETVLTGFIPQSGYDGPRSDDQAGIRALYGVEDGSSCEGPFRVGEECTCNGDCVEGNVCAPADNGALICTPTCDSDDADCAISFGCLMRVEGDGAAGFCARQGSEGLPPGAICNNDSQCSRGLCLPVTALARTVCRVTCEADADCEDEDYACTDGACVYDGEINGEGCGCGCEASETSEGAAAGWLLVLGLATVAPLLRRRRRA